MLKYRLLSTVILLPIVIIALFLLPKIVFTLLTIIICMISAWEWGQLAGFVCRFKRLDISIFFCILLLLMWQAQYTLWISLVWWLTSPILVISYPYSAAFWRGYRMLRLFFGIITIIPFCLAMLILRQHHYDVNHFTGAWWLLYILILVWSLDSGAYIFGSIFGRHKLRPKVSPGKTWEGLVGGLLTSFILSWMFSKYAPLDTSISSIKLFICSLITVLAAVMGDLTESMFKREVGLKESGMLIPGHGGILDRIDSLTAAVPVFVCLMRLFHAI